MGSTRALFASIGVSVSLIAAAALSLFAVSVVIAFGGWSAGIGESGPATTLVFASHPAPAKHGRAHKAAVAPVVLHAAAPSRPRTSPPPRAHAIARTGSDAHARVISHAMITSGPPKPVVQAPPAPAPAAVVQTKPATGDGVRRVGEGLSSTVEGTGKALAAVTAPLGPPVTAAVQKVIDLVATLLQRTTSSLAGTLDAVGKR
ncbi:MAG: hypothetical protein QOD69_26 [Solirubrobacteraceae bacterium]|jgi:hypothetical protein|nr:hypothetical protein [Solirubrobacteraceae bacterium]